jgi:tRNA threonylcarbamoyladenosine biosynthesis protein TsaE
MKIASEQEMLEFGTTFAKNVKAPAVIELIGDVGAGKTTFTRGFASGLGIESPVTSPSFTVSKSYAAPDGTILTHYDFYRLGDPGLMAEDLEESINSENTITIVEWGNSIENILPGSRTIIEIRLEDDGSREVTIKSPNTDSSTEPSTEPSIAPKEFLS